MKKGRWSRGGLSGRKLFAVAGVPDQTAEGQVVLFEDWIDTVTSFELLSGLTPSRG